VGPGFALLARGAPPLPPAAAGVRERVGVRLVVLDGGLDVDGAYARWFDRHGCDAVLVRPDHLVFGAAAGPGAAARLLEELDRALAGDAPR
jgi:hypothetical protein